MKRVLSIAFIICLVIIALDNSTIVYAQGQTRINIRIDKDSYKVDDIFKVYIEGQDVVDMFGVQFTLEYDPDKLEMQGDDMVFLGDYQFFGGTTVDKENGILTYPLINGKSTTELIETEQIGYVTFKALEKGPAIFTLKNIKAVDRNIKQIQYNTQDQQVINITQASSSPLDDNDSESNESDDNSETSKPDSSTRTENSSDNTSDSTSDKSDELNIDDDERLDSEDDNDREDTDIQDDQIEEDTDDKDITDDAAKDEQKPLQSDDTNKTNIKAILIGIAVLAIVGLAIYLYNNKRHIKSVFDKIKNRNKGV